MKLAGRSSGSGGEPSPDAPVGRLMSPEDVFQDWGGVMRVVVAVRAAGRSDLGDAAAVVIESDGTLTVLLKPQPAPEQTRGLHR